MRSHLVKNAKLLLRSHSACATLGVRSHLTNTSPTKTPHLFLKFRNLIADYSTQEK